LKEVKTIYRFLAVNDLSYNIQVALLTEVYYIEELSIMSIKLEAVVVEIVW